MAIRFLSGQTIDGTLTVSGNVQGATFNSLAINTTGTNNLANQIVRTDVNGHAKFGWINSVSGNHTGTITRITASNDAYLRYVTPAQFRTGVTDGYYAPVSTVSGVTSVATTNGITGGTIISTGTIQVDSTVVRTTGDQSITGNTQFYPSSTGTGYSTAAIELMASSSGASGTPPRIGFHWGGVVASNISIESNGTIVIRDNPGTGYEDFKALNITATGVVYASGGNSGTWNSHTSNTGTVTSVATGNGIGGGTITTTGTLTVGAGNGLSQSADGLLMSGSYTGGFTATTSMTSPIYYDANDGGYYGDFASTSVFNKINTGIGNLGRSRMASYSMTAGNWYRIANGSGRACGDIYIQDGISGGPHGNITFYAGSSYSQYAGTMLKLKSSSFYSVIGFTEIRLLIGTTYQDQFVEILCQRTGTYYITVQDTHANTNNWTLSTSATVGSVPTGYSDSTRLDINGMLIAEAGNGSNRFAVDRVGAIHLSGGTSGSSGQVLTSGGTGSPTWTTLQNQTGGPFLPLAGGTVTGLTNLIAGSKIVVQNGTNGGVSRGIFMWTNTDANWGIYMATPGATQNIAGGAAPSGLNGESSHSIRFRIASGATNGFIWENSNNATLMSMNGNSGNLTTGASMRSPIFYDKNNTDYYGHFDSYSSMWGVAIRGDKGAADIGNQIFFYGSGGSTTSAIGFKNGGQFANPTGQGDGWNTHFTMDTANRGWVFRRGTGGANFTSAFTSGWILNTGEWQANTSMKAPIFYDSANTAYYGDFASTSNMFQGYYKGKTDGWSLQLGDADITRVYDDDARASLVINAAYYPHLYINANTTNSNLNHGAVFSMTGNISGGGFRRWSIGIPNTNPNMLTIGTYDNNDNPHYGCGGDVLGEATWGSKFWLDSSSNLQTNGSMRSPIFYDSANTGFYLDPASTGTSLNVAGDVVAYASSDIRFKNNVLPITNALDKINKIGGYTFEWNEKSHKETGKKDIGVIAQEVEEILPEIVDTRDNGYKAVDYSKLTALLIQSVKEQQVIIDNLKSRIETLENN